VWKLANHLPDLPVAQLWMKVIAQILQRVDDSRALPKILRRREQSSGVLAKDIRHVFTARGHYGALRVGDLKLSSSVICHLRRL
jgi:hypothetical protein